VKHPNSSWMDMGSEVSSLDQYQAHVQLEMGQSQGPTASSGLLAGCAVWHPLRLSTKYFSLLLT
jgi:hypothetical protein